MNGDQLGLQSETLNAVFFAPIPRCVILDKTLPRGLLRLYCYLVARCNTEEMTTWVSQQTIADDLEVSREHINRDLKTLAERKLISVSKTDRGNNTYRINDVTKVYGNEVARRKWPKHKPAVNHSEEPRTSHPLYQGHHTPRTRKVT